MDEETPHIHIDFVTFTRNSKRGLDTRVSLKGALAEQGFRGGTRGDTEWNQWIKSEKQERTREVAELDRQIESSQTMLCEATQLVDSRLERAGELADMGERLQKKNDELRSEHKELEMAKDEAMQSHTRLSQQNQSLQVEKEVLEDERLRLKSGNRELSQVRDPTMRIPQNRWWQG